MNMRRLDGFDHNDFCDPSADDGDNRRGVSDPSVSIGISSSNDPDETSNPWSLELDCSLAAMDSPRSFFLPLHYEPGYQYPLIVWLHCDGFNEHQVEQVMPHVSLQNFVGVGVRGVRAADAMGHRFDWPQSRAAVEATWRQVSSVIEEAKSRFSIHPERIVLAGYGTGGTMALRLGLRQPEAFAGVVSLGGYLPSKGRLFSDLDALRRSRLPILWQWAMEGDHFDDDHLASDLRKLLLTKCSIEVRQYRDHDEMNTITLSDINDWVMRRVVSGTVCEENEEAMASPRLFSAN